MADSAENIANEVLALKDREMTSETILNDIAKFSAQVTKISERSLKAFLTGEIKLANEAGSSAKSRSTELWRSLQKCASTSQYGRPDQVRC